MQDDRVDIKRARSGSDTGSVGSHGRKRAPEKLVDKNRSVRALGTAEVDDGAKISAGLASTVTLKAFLLKTTWKCTRTGRISLPYWGQVGLIRGERLTDSPSEKSPKRQAVAGDDGKKTASSSLRCSHFAVIPTTCLHNVEDEEVNGEAYTFRRAEISAPGEGEGTFELDFDCAGIKASASGDSIVLRAGDANQQEIRWDYYDIATGVKIDNPQSPLTEKIASYEKMERVDYKFQVGQKIGMAVYRNFEVTDEDAGMTKGTITTEELRKIFGRENRVNIYTGQITRVSPGGEAFEHDINSFRGCSGAIIFLLDSDQDGYGVKSSDYGKAIAVHVGGQRLENGLTVK